MLTKLYCIYDSKSKVYGRIFPCLNDQVAIRAVSDSMSPDTELGRHPEDFSLFHLGSYDDGNALIDVADVATLVIKLHEIV